MSRSRGDLTDADLTGAAIAPLSEKNTAPPAASVEILDHIYTVLDVMVDHCAHVAKIDTVAEVDAGFND